MLSLLLIVLAGPQLTNPGAQVPGLTCTGNVCSATRFNATSTSSQAPGSFTCTGNPASSSACIENPNNITEIFGQVAVESTSPTNCDILTSSRYNNAAGRTQGYVFCSLNGETSVFQVGYEGSLTMLGNFLNMTGTAPRLQSTTANTTLIVRGNRDTANSNEDLLIGSQQTRTGGPLVTVYNGNTEKMRFDNTGKLSWSASEYTDDSANTGDRTVNKVSGVNAFAAAATAITITNSRVTAASIVFAVLQTNDTTAILKNVVPASGSFTINLSAAATGTTKVAWWVVN